MKDISVPVEKKDHRMKMSGRAEYTADMKLPGMLYSSFVRSEVPHARIKDIKLPVLPDGYFSVSGSDIPNNHCACITDEQPVFADKEVMFVGEAILLICGPDEKTVKQLCAETEVIYEELPAVLSLDEATEVALGYEYHKGDTETVFNNADRVISETFRTGYQEQAYIETQSAVGVWDKDKGKAILYGSMQCPYYVHSALMHSFELDESHVRVVQEVTGGGFGGKEDFPSLLGCQAVAAARKSGHPVRIVLNRREDMSVTTKRHPAILKYDAALDKEGHITGLRADIRMDSGAYPGLTSVVMQRTLLAALGVYKIDNLDVKGRAMTTNLVNNGAYRGFGAPQAFFAIETLMNHIADKLGVSPLAYRQMHFVKQGDETGTGGKFWHHVPIPEMIAKAEEMSDYSKKYEEYSLPQSGRYRKGIGMSIFFHGCGFTGSAEKDFIKSKLTLHKYADDRVEILASNTDMGQGLKTTFSKIAAKVLDIPYEQIIIENPDTDRVPNSGPTVASRSLMIDGKLIERAAARLKEIWKPGKEQEIMEQYKEDRECVPWDIEKFHGDAYPTFSWGLNVVELQEDILTGNTDLLGVWGIYDVGHVIDERIMEGQAQGGILQGIGYGSMEHMEAFKGRIRQNSFTDYMIPTAMDTVNNGIAFIDNLYKDGPFGAKGAGELTLVGAAPAYEAAVEQASGKHFMEIPLTPEKILLAE